MLITPVPQSLEGLITEERLREIIDEAYLKSKGSAIPSHETAAVVDAIVGAYNTYGGGTIPIPRTFEEFCAIDGLSIFESGKLLLEGHRAKRTIHPSEIIMCPLKALFCLRGEYKIPTSKTLQGIFDIGHWVHAGVQAAYKAAWPECVIEARVKWPEENVTGSADIWYPKVCVIDIKTIASSQFDLLVGPRDYHVDQLLIYMRVLGERFGAVLYVDKERGRKLWEPFEFDSERWLHIFNRIRNVREAHEKGSLVEGKYSYMLCRDCEYRKICPVFKERSSSRPRADITSEDVPWIS